jgi:hypothetical protein
MIVESINFLALLSVALEERSQRELRTHKTEGVTSNWGDAHAIDRP